jgi:hypothetical protein
MHKQPINGSFETTLGTCSYNESNFFFNRKMSNCFAFGDNSEIDIIKDTCGYGPAQDGNYFLGIAVDNSNELTDALSLELSSPLIEGKTYVLNFYSRKDPDFDANLLEVGYTKDSLSFGTSIGSTSSLPTTSWEPVSFTFTPSFNSKFITIRTIAGIYGWNFIDNFTILQTSGINSTSAKEPFIQIYPSPTSDQIAIFTDISTEIYSIIVLDIQGKIILKTDKTILDLSKLTSGIYIVELITNKGRIVRRVVRE